jgi:SAM-dependent methyltransferase
MSVASHLGIRVAEYDRRIRTFVPDYEEMLTVGAEALRPIRRSPTIVDLGTGTGALAARCLQLVPEATVLGLDTDSEMLAVAARRLRGKPRATLEQRSFSRGSLPACDYFTAALSLHHVKRRHAKTALYRRCHDALRPGGALVTVDCMPPANRALRRFVEQAWTRHMARTYARREIEGFLAAWAQEDRYFTLNQESAMLAAAGFQVDVVWRRNEFAVVRATRPRRR